MRSAASAVALFLASAAAAPPAAPAAAPPAAQAAGPGIRIEFDARLHSRLVSTLDGAGVPLGPLSASETVVVGGAERADFALQG
ncbi:MAG TPA: hypothetical protein VIG50_08720, partial [Vicinamibacteria bacterium]